MPHRRAPRSFATSVRVSFLVALGMSAAYACAAPPRATPPERTPTYREDVAPGVEPIDVKKESVDDPATAGGIPESASGGTSTGGGGGSLPSLATGGSAG